MPPAICVNNLGKRYRVNHAEARLPYRTLRDTLSRAISAPIRRWRAGGHAGVVEQFWALKDVSFEVQPGEVVGIIGRNGAGKSTLLKILSRITKPSKGLATIHGRVGSLLEVGTGFHPELTGRENIFMNGSILGMPRVEIKRKFDEIVDFSGVEQFLDTPVKRYSSGMQVRLAFAVAAHLDPEILIVDEVLAVGDAEFQEKCLGKMKDVATGGRTVLLVSHNMVAIQHLCERVILVDSGQIAMDGKSRDVVQSHLGKSRDTTGTSIREWRDRETNGQAKIVDLKAIDLTHQTENIIAFGADLQLTIEAEFYRPVRDPIFGVHFHTIDGEPILDFRSSHDGLRVGRVEGLVAVKATIAQLGLYPGEFLLSPFITDAACTTNIDWVKHCTKLRVQAAPGPKGDLKLKWICGRYWVPSHWDSRSSVAADETADRSSHSMS